MKHAIIFLVLAAVVFIVIIIQAFQLPEEQGARGMWFFLGGVIFNQLVFCAVFAPRTMRGS